ICSTGLGNRCELSYLLLDPCQFGSQVGFLDVEKHVDVADAGIAVASNGRASTHDADTHADLTQDEAGLDAANIVRELVGVRNNVFRGHHYILETQRQGLCALESGKFEAGPILEA